MRRSFRTRVSFSGWIPRVCTLGWYAMPLQGKGMGFETGLGHGIGNGSTLRQNGIESDKKSFGETFGAATVVSDLRLSEIRIRNDGVGGDAAAVAGHVGPGFQTWPLGHTNQTRDRKRRRPICPKGAAPT